MKKVDMVHLNASLKSILRTYPNHRYGIACALFDKLGLVLAREMQTNEDFENVMQSFLGIGFETVDFSISIKLDGENLVFNQVLLKGEANDKTLSFEV